MDSEPIDSIHLSGFSRGGVTTFAAARHLDDLGIPLSLHAQDPVPGVSMAAAAKKKSLFAVNRDLRDLHNLQEATVGIGLYSKENASLQNKYFRQMVPTFPRSTEQHIIAFSKDQHMRFDPCSENHLRDSLRKHGIMKPRYYKDANTRLHFVPTVWQQSLHDGATGRIRIAPRYAAYLHDNLKQKGVKVDSRMPIRTAQALLALSYVGAEKNLEQLVRADGSDKGKGIRDFIIEFENINQFILEKSSDSNTVSAIDHYRTVIYQRLADYPFDKAGPGRKEDFQNQILNEVKTLKEKIPARSYEKLHELMTLELRRSPLLHQDLCQFIDEGQKLDSRYDTNAPPAPPPRFSEVTKADELIKMLTSLSARKRSRRYSEFADKIPEVATNARELGTILRFLPEDKVIRTLADEKMQALIQKPDDLIKLLDAAINKKQKKAIFKACGKKYQNMTFKPQQKARLQQHLPSLRSKQEKSTITSNHNGKKIQKRFKEKLESLKPEKEKNNHAPSLKTR